MKNFKEEFLDFLVKENDALIDEASNVNNDDIDVGYKSTALIAKMNIMSKIMRKYMDMIK